MSLTPDPISNELGPVPAPSAVGEPGFTPPLDVVLVPEKRFPAWTGWDVFAVAFVSAIAVFVFIAVGLLATGIFASPKAVSVTELARDARVIRVFLAAQAAAYLVVLVCIFLIVRSRAAEPFGRAIQWTWPGKAGLRFFVSGIVLALVVDFVSRYLPMPKSLPMEDLFTNRTNAYLLAAFGLTLAPLLEELFFRGLLYPVLRRATGLVSSVLLTGIAFAAIHSTQLGYAWAPLLSILVVGIVFTVVRERRSSVAASFIMHCGYNFTLFAMLWLATDHFRHLEKVAS
jgi:membrane protease YdiL (CAAX protease family)